VYLDIQSSIIFSDIALYLQPCVRSQTNNNIICTAVVYDITIRFHPIDASADSLHAHPNSKQCATLIFHQVARVRLMCVAQGSVCPSRRTGIWTYFTISRGPRGRRANFNLSLGTGNNNRWNTIARGNNSAKRRGKVDPPLTQKWELRCHSAITVRVLYTLQQYIGAPASVDYEWI